MARLFLVVCFAIVFGSLNAVSAPPDHGTATLNISGFADFYECRHSFQDRCMLWIHHDPNLDIQLTKISDQPETWEGSVTRDDSQFGLDAIVDIEVQKVVDPRVSDKPQYGISAQVRKRDGTVLVRWVNISFFGEPANINRIQIYGPEFDNVNSDLYKAKLFLYLNQPFAPALKREWIDQADKAAP
jgi:hypothetical protein